MSELRKSATVPLDFPPAPRDEPLVLSYAQRRLWFLQQVQPGASEAYNIPLGLMLRGELDDVALGWALDRMVERHEPLRTRIEYHRGEGFQKVGPAKGFVLLRQDLSEAVDRMAQLQAVMLDEVRTPFVLEKGPLCRGRLIRMAPREHVLLVTTHHIISDGWSMEVFIKELGVLYDSYPDCASASLPTLTLQYADYALWQRRWLSSEMLKPQVDYWRTALADAPSVLDLPTDRRRPPTQDFSGDTIAIDFDQVLTRKLQKLALQHNTTLFQLLLAAWAVVLSRLSGEDQVIIGVPAANRLHPSVDIEELIGLFVNTLPLRIEVPADSTLEAVLSCAARAVLSAHVHADIPFERIVEVVNPNRSPAYTPLFQVMFAWQNVETLAGAFRGLEARPIRMPLPTAKYDLTLDLSETGGRISGHLNYATALFDAETARRHVSYLREVLLQMTVDMQQRVVTVSLLSEKERHWVLEDCNHTQVDFGPEQRVDQLFEAQVARTPNAVALSYRGQTLTYAELGRRSNSVARHLRDRGIGCDQLVGLCMERGLEMVVGLLGILKSGAAYVPIDPDYPRARQQFIVRDAALKVILTQESLRERVPGGGVRVIALDTDWGTIAATGEAPVDLPPGEKSARSLLYVIYTSGSTGEPKGVEAEHLGTANRIRAQQLFDPLLADEVCIQKTSIGFVDSIFETLGPLMYGVPLVIAGSEVSTDMAKLPGFIKENRITRLVSVPSLAQAMLEKADITASLATLRTWTLSGEELKGPLLRRLQAALPRCRFVNLYGSSEVAADVTCYVAGLVDGDRVPIGKPLANTQIYILDGFSKSVPIGVAGELHVAGAGVARGYHRRPDLTAAHFVSNPFGIHSPGRLYKTGDRARWRPDGTIEYLGRDDHQVKIRGVRVELEEIARQLETHETVKNAVVALREDVAGDARLVAYVIPEDKPSACSDELRIHLRAVLPDYMLPNVFVVLQSFPLSPNGKVDRKALPPPEQSSEHVRRYEAPQGRVETALAEIWRRLLNVEPVGRNDNFFELGGHSMRVVELMAAIADTFSIEVNTALIFQAPTLGEMARCVGGLLTGNDEEPLRPRDPENTVPLTAVMLKIWRWMEQTGTAQSERKCTVSMRISGPLNVAAVQRSIQALVDRHESLRTRVIKGEDGQPQQQVDREQQCTVPIIEISAGPDGDTEEMLRQRAEEFAREKVELAVGPLFAARIFKVSASDHVLIMAIDHMVADGVSLEILNREFWTLYQQATRGAPLSLPSLPIQSADYAVWQTRNHDAWKAMHGAYWQSRLRGAPILELPRGTGLIEVARPVGEELRFSFDVASSEGVRQVARQARTLTPLVVVAIHMMAVSQWYEQRDLTLTLVGNGRYRPELRDIIGYLTDYPYLRVEIRDQDTFMDVIRRITSEYHSASQHPCFGRLSELLPGYRTDLSFNWQPYNWIPWLADEQWNADANLSVRSFELQKAYPAVFAPFFYETRRGIGGTVVYRPDCLRRTTVERFAANLLLLARKCVEDPGCQFGAIAASLEKYAIGA